MKQFVILLAVTALVTCGNLNNEYLPPSEGVVISSADFQPASRKGTQHTAEENGFPSVELNGTADDEDELQKQNDVPLFRQSSPSVFPKAQYTPSTAQPEYSTSERLSSSVFPLQRQLPGTLQSGLQFAPQQITTKFKSNTPFSSQNQYNAPPATLYGVPVGPQKSSVLPKYQPGIQFSSQQFGAPQQGIGSTSGIQQFGTPTTKFQSGPSFSSQYQTRGSVLPKSDTSPLSQTPYQISPLAKAQFGTSFGSQQLGQTPSATQYNAPSQKADTLSQQYGVPSTQNQAASRTYGAPSAVAQYQGPFGTTPRVGIKTTPFQGYPSATPQFGRLSIPQDVAYPKSQFDVPVGTQRSALILPNQQQYGTIQDSQGGYKY